MKVHLHYFSKIKSQKESQNSRIQDFCYYFCMMIEGSGWPKNTWIRIRNTGKSNHEVGWNSSVSILKLCVCFCWPAGWNVFCSRCPMMMTSPSSTHNQGPPTLLLCRSRTPSVSKQNVILQLDSAGSYHLIPTVLQHWCKFLRLPPEAWIRVKYFWRPRNPVLWIGNGLMSNQILS